MVFGYHERDKLVARQIAATDFYGSVHDEYHVHALGMQSDLDNLLSNAKRVLNRLALLWGAALPHRLKRRVRSSSFGSFVQSFDPPGPLGSRYQVMRRNLHTRGRLPDEHIGDYRDKHIEHVRASPAGLGLSTGPTTGVTKLHVPAGNCKRVRSKSVFSDTPYIVYRSPEGEIYQLHVASLRRLRDAFFVTGAIEEYLDFAVHSLLDLLGHNRR